MGYIGMLVYGRNEGNRKPGKVVGYRDCTLEGCGGTRVAVRWPDKTLTWPCVRGMKYRTDGSLQII